MEKEEDMRHQILLSIIAALTLGIGLQATATATAETESEVRRQLASARNATHQYHDAAVAVEDGFLATDECVELPDGGGMGFHYVNPGRIDTDLAITEPDAVLYEPEGNRRKLVAIEYIVPDQDQNLATDDDRPVLFGVPFDGPMLGHTHDMPIHYDLHVWVWEANPDGMFAQWNPNVEC
jgi:hypothetical protein